MESVCGKEYFFSEWNGVFFFFWHFEKVKKEWLFFLN